MTPEFENFENDFLTQEQVEEMLDAHLMDGYDPDWDDDDWDLAYDYEDDGQPDEYTEWQDYMGGDDWDG